MEYPPREVQGLTAVVGRGKVPLQLPTKVTFMIKAKNLYVHCGMIGEVDEVDTTDLLIVRSL